MLSYYGVFSCSESVLLWFMWIDFQQHFWPHLQTLCTGESLKLNGQSLTSMQPLKIQIFYLAASIGEQHLKSYLFYINSNFADM